MQSFFGSPVGARVRKAVARPVRVVGCWLVLAVVRTAAGGTTMHVSSPAFRDQAEIPTKYTCEGGDVSPPLAWDDVPTTSRSLALVIDDPDAPDPRAPKRTWVHWVLFDVPPSATGLAEDAARKGLPPGARQGKNDWGKETYGGPCPPVGRHRYFVKLYALDTTLDANPPATKADLEKAMAGHIVASAQMFGTYEKKKR